ncbi:GntR family transcriptional regulator [Mesorhizobium sp. B2-3-3]|uniref:GntR family transcriptional regulator n=1 Tax=Mesorhizobium sp. B2-4-15 TaxID=2589934 RepID=UPI001152F097|nr:GntR family transcriptional regulator [Mesorhizobium sp. B2-4-15]TPK61492.1 GntR family transcriptional regulator [Mesorhizobium sp. B2-4-15]TPM87434.1 GntR family transcriptional regulator [Mesorhizobium sp. B2-3-3]
MALEKLSLVDRAAQQLRQMIVGATLSPGLRLTEQDLSDEMQVARGTIRAALAALAAENLVIRRPYVGWAVQAVDGEVLRESYQVRGALEELSVRLLATDLDRDKRADLVASYDRLVLAECTGEAEDRLRADLGFHAGIVRASGNKLLLRQYESISAQTEWLYRWSEKNWPRRINLVDWHKPIFEAILAQDAEAAAAAVRIHTQRSLHDDMQDLHTNPSTQINR